MARRHGTRRHSGRARSRRGSKGDGAAMGVLLILGGGFYFAHLHPDLAGGLAAAAVLLGNMAWYASRRRSAAYRAALLECGAGDPMQLSPVEFEQFCGMLPAGRGWSVQATRTTGDYWADIVAERDGVRLVVQCERWSNAAGVAAVQEAHAAIAFYGAHRSAVMATSGFTRAAEALAGTTGTALIVPGRHDIDRVLGR